MSDDNKKTILYGPYLANFRNSRKTIDYVGNNINKNITDISFKVPEDYSNRIKNFIDEEKYFHLHKIDHQIFLATVDFFTSIKAEWCNLPLTTLMISSPGEVYAGQILNYTSDALPVEISWFNHRRNIFLSESSQFYLELRLLIPRVEKVFSIYNSFRKEKADISHLSEFQHIEFEGHVSFEENLNISLDLLDHLVKYLIKNAYENLTFFISESEIENLQFAFEKKNFEFLTFTEAMKILRHDTSDAIYDEISLKNFGAWEEIRLTRHLGKHAIVTDYPLMEIPFYHNSTNSITAENADIILYGYREVIGSGRRIIDRDIMLKKAEFFNLPKEDYAPYLESRNIPTYRPSSGFGLGWQRFVHWLLKLSDITESTHIPRGHWMPSP